MKIMIVFSVILALCANCPSPVEAQSESASYRLRIESADLPVEERNLLESNFSCSPCGSSDVQAEVADQVRGLGYFKAVVSLPSRSSDKALQLMEDVLTVRAGHRYYLSDSKIVGANVLLASDLQKAIPLGPHTIFSAPLVGKSLELLRERYAAVGHQDAVITPTLAFDEVHRTVALTLFVDEK